MALLAYATEADLTSGGWVDDPPDDIKRRLYAASLLVDEVCTFDEYDTNPDGSPASTEITEAFRDAVCLQIAAWADAGINPLAGASGQAPRVASQSVDGASVSYTGLPSAEEISRMVDTLCAPAILLLKQAGLASRTPGML